MRILDDLIAGRNASGARYAKAVAELRAATIELASFDEAARNQGLHGGTVLGFGPLVDPRSLEHREFVPHVQGDWASEIREALNTRLAEKAHAEEVRAARNARLAAHPTPPDTFALEAGIAVDTWQKGVMETTDERSVYLCSRQVGKSTVAVLAALHWAVHKPGSHITLVAPSEEQARALVERIETLHADLGDVPELSVSTNRYTASFENGALIRMLGGGGDWTGYAETDLIVIDDAAAVAENAATSLLTPTQARVIALSTPADRSGWFFDTWHGAGDKSTWHRVEVSPQDCPRLTQEFLDRELRSIGQERFAIEYGLQFVDRTE